MQTKIKKKRKDKFKNRNKPAKNSWPKRQVGKWWSVDGTIDGLKFFPEKLKAVIGMTCGRCGATKVVDSNRKIKCINRNRTDLAQKNVWYCEIKGKKFL